MIITVINSEKAPKAVGPYRDEIKNSGLVFTSGQIAIDPSCGKLVERDIITQTRQVMENLREVLKTAGSDFSKVIKVSIFLKILVISAILIRFTRNTSLKIHRHEVRLKLLHCHWERWLKSK